MLAQDVQVTGQDVRLVGDRWHLVGIDQPLAQVVEPVLAGQIIEERAQCLIGGVEPGQQRRELFLLGGRHRRQGVERGEDQPLLVLGQLDVGDRHRRLVSADGELDPEVPVDDVPRRPVDQHLGDPADLTQGAGQRPLLLRRMAPPVAWVGDEFRRRDVGVAHDPIAPGDGRCRRHLKPRPCIVARTE